MSTRRNPRFLLAGVLAVVALGGVAAFALANPGAADDGVFAVGMDDGEVALEAATLAPGRQVIEVTNAGSEEHEVVVLRTKKAADELAVGLHGVSIGLSGELVVGEDHVKLRHRHKPGDVLGLLPGESQRYQAELDPGHYVVYCQSGSHYLQAGEAAELTVE